MIGEGKKAHWGTYSKYILKKQQGVYKAFLKMGKTY